MQLAMLESLIGTFDSARFQSLEAISDIINLKREKEISEDKRFAIKVRRIKTETSKILNNPTGHSIKKEKAFFLPLLYQCL